MDPMDSIGRLSNPPLSIVYASGFILWLNFRYLKWTLLHFRFHFSTRLRWTPGFVHWNLVESVEHVWCVFNLSYLTSGIKLCSVGIFASNPTTTGKTNCTHSWSCLGFLSKTAHKNPHLLDSFSPFFVSFTKLGSDKFYYLVSDLLFWLSQLSYVRVVFYAPCGIYMAVVWAGQRRQHLFQFRCNAGLVRVKWSSLDQSVKYRGPYLQP